MGRCLATGWCGLGRLRRLSGSEPEAVSGRCIKRSTDCSSKTPIGGERNMAHWWTVPIPCAVSTVDVAVKALLRRKLAGLVRQER